MTREEKIELLEKEKAYMLSHGGDRQAIALDSAIKALEQEPCDDAISQILKRMWNCRTSIDKVKMEQIIRDELSSVMVESRIRN